MIDEENEADEQSKGFMSSGFAEEMREHVTDGGDETLYSHKLGNGKVSKQKKVKL